MPNTKCGSRAHTLGDSIAVGGGLLRRTCSVCRSVVLDHRDEGPVETSLFRRPRVTSAFVMLTVPAAVLAHGRGRSFGKRPDDRRRAPQQAVA